ncbi:ferric uptake regulation protein [[Synechococcus] sp. NIES-970]|uniref:Fur family transcriptional regulator n=1 Tax=Picosynechococcus sp. NKBG15041c TaxID=1407650 RepID=UPI00040B8080|nr:transcriptional repressor [Picosynechococcus sp. NKBG15041c]BAW95647.1 ferric uptake regulation protein [[Synechococcus] sp. NIES-970]
MSKKLTKNQQQILQLIQTKEGEISAQSLHLEMKQAGITIGLATVYRALKLFKVEGKIQERVTPEGESFYSKIDAPEHHHHHLNCVNCGQSYPLDSCPIGQKITDWCQTQKFKVYYHTLEFFGLCADCQAQGESVECFNAN